ncbi:MAG: DUF3015 domain-containing protein [Elusimicrobia bacterium]|nr:DUF3015 domain-containing protein [Elusimicrobiota bacterium]
MKKAFLALIAVTALSSFASAFGANDENIGCGWGTELFSGKTDKKVYALLGATTNGMSTQTFGISSETAGCTTKGAWVRNEKKQAAYAEVNLQKLSTEMAQGGGEYLNAFASLMGANDDASKKAFISLTQAKYEVLFPTANTDSATMLRNLRAEMAVNPKLATL